MIQFKIRNLPEISKKISDLPRSVRGAATEAAAMALIGNSREGLQAYPARKQHGAGNPYVWQSEKQRRAYFATNGFGGGIPYNRTQTLRFGWQVSKWGDGTKMKVLNDVPYVKYVQADGMQMGHLKDGWKFVAEIIGNMNSRMNKAIDQAVARWLKSKGLT